MAANPTDYEAIEPSIVRPMKWRDRTVEVRPLKVGQIPGFAKAVRPILAAVPADLRLEDVDVVGLVADHGDALISACAIAVPSIPETEIREAELDEFMLLIAEVLAANGDFFRRRMPQAAPKLAAMLSSIGDGSTLSKS